MSTPTLCLDGMILAATAYPSGFSYSLFTSWSGAPRGGSTVFLWFLALPYLVVCPTVWGAHPALISLRGTTALLVATALLMAPLAFAIEYCIHAAALYVASGTFPRWFAVHHFWRRRLSLGDHALLWMVVVGEEFVYRAIWFGVFHRSFGLSVPLALAASSLAYGINHLSFGWLSVLSKTAMGLCYGFLYLLSAECIWIPILTHGLQNVALFSLARERHV